MCIHYSKSVYGGVSMGGVLRGASAWRAAAAAAAAAHPSLLPLLHLFQILYLPQLAPTNTSSLPHESLPRHSRSPAMGMASTPCPPDHPGGGCGAPFLSFAKHRPKGG